MSEFEKRELELEKLGLGNIDNERDENGNPKFYFDSSFDSSKESINNLLDLDINNLENKLNIKILINKEKKGIVINDENGYEIGRIEPGIFTRGKFKFYDHLYKKIDKSERGKGYGTILMNLYKKHFSLPKSECSYKVSSIKLLLKFGYKIDGKFINGDKVFVSEDEINLILNGKNNYDELDVIYSLFLEE